MPRYSVRLERAIVLTIEGTREQIEEYVRGTDDEILDDYATDAWAIAYCQEVNRRPDCGIWNGKLLHVDDYEAEVAHANQLPLPLAKDQK